MEVRRLYRQRFGIVDEIILFHAGRLTEVKNQFFIIDILKGLLDNYINTKLYIAGDGELRNKLVDYSCQIGAEDKVTFLGSRNDLNGLYQMADVFLLPSFHEGFPVTLVEAQAAGLPCIASTGVSEETNLTGKVKYVSLKEDLKVWINAVMEIYEDTKNRHDVYRGLIEKRFGIKQVAEDFKSYLGI